MALSPDQRRQIIEFIQSGTDDNREIAGRVGVSPGTVAAVKAHMTMGSYGGTTTLEEVEQIEEAAELKFGLERDLQNALRQSIELLEIGLRIVDGGKERTVEGFRFDITAEDTAGRLVILELKAGTADRNAVSQLLAYIGALLEQEQTREIRGILVAHEFDRTAKLAARAAGSISLIRYGFQFTFEPA
jgi:hypothetical protein